MEDTPAEGDAPAEPDPGSRRSRRLAIAAFLLAVTSTLMAWWRVTWSSSSPDIREDVHLFRPMDPLTTGLGPWLTGAIVVVAILILFVRIAARSEKYEPPVWRRDLGVAAVLLAVALLSCMLWPAEVPAFWGGRTYEGNITDGEPVTETAMPGLGWWLAMASVLVLAWARVSARPATEK
jgi:hypothetical protein